MHEFNFFIWLAEKAGLEKYVSGWWVSILSSLLVLFVLTVISILVWRKLRRVEEAMIPSEKFSLQNIIELMVEWLLKMMQGVLGDRAERFLPLIGTLFVYIFCCNLLGFIPGFISPTTVITTNFACAMVVFVYYNYVGIKEWGVIRYFRSFLGPVIWLAPLFFCIELVSHLVRPISLSVRLYGNMLGDHMALGVFSGLVPLVIPIFFIVLGIFISFIQAFVFSILSTVYIALAVKD